MKVIAISDLHGNLPKLPPCDLLLIGGDICPTANHASGFQQLWLDGNFRYWLKEQEAKHIVGIAGNHDFIFQEGPHWVPKDLNWKYLQDSGTEIEGLKIWGTPWQPIFFDWAFNLSEIELEKKWKLIPTDTDIVISHGPPRGFGDGATKYVNGKRMNGEIEHVGSPSLLERLKLIKPKLTVFGHIHGGFGRWEEDGMVLANVSFVNEKYIPKENGWLEIEL